MPNSIFFFFTISLPHYLVLFNLFSKAFVILTITTTIFMQSDLNDEKKLEDFVGVCYL